MELNEEKREKQREEVVKEKPSVPLTQAISGTIEGAIELTTKMIILLHHGRSLYEKSNKALDDGKWMKSNELRAEGTQYFEEVEKLFKDGLK
jgi:hypothetical protein